MAAAPSSSKSATLQYMPGFGNHFSSEAVPGTLPQGQNSPQQCPFGLYAEQLSGTAFTAPRKENQRSWLYRIKPSVMHRPFKPCADDVAPLLKSDFNTPDCVLTPNQMRWMPITLPSPSASASSAPSPSSSTPSGSVDFINGLVTYCGAGEATLKTGLAIHIYVANTPMGDRAFCNADGDFLFVPQEGGILLRTEFGQLEVPSGSVACVQRGIRFSVDPMPNEGKTAVRGYLLELFSGHLRIPDLGPIGANGLANPRDFQTPVAAFEDRECAFEVIHKFGGKLFSASMDFSPYNVVAWHGNYAPYRYDLSRFNTMNTVSFDHPDPSIFTVLTCPTTEPGVAVCDFVIFPGRWMTAEHTFRPPYFHRNCMAEFMGLIRGSYDAKEKGFVPGGASLHSIGTPHGPESEVFEKASRAALEPVRYPDTALAFMFETTYTMKLTAWAAANNIDDDYWKCWQGMKKYFDGKNPSPM